MRSDKSFSIQILQQLCLLLLLSSFWTANAADTQATTTETSTQNNSAAVLNAQYKVLNKQLFNNQFQRPLYITSAESSQDLKGEIYAVVDYPFSLVKEGLNNPDHWCDIFILHIDIQYCHATTISGDSALTVNLGKKFYQPLADTYRVIFKYNPVSSTEDYFAIAMNAEHGPIGTHDYRIWLEATPLKDGRTFLHFTYGYAFGLSGRLAMKAYLATLGRDKVGFTMQETPGKPLSYIKGVRGVVERNTMRYYLAIDAYLAAEAAAPEDRLEKRLQLWHSSIEQYARQLLEVESEDYLAMKRKQYLRQQTAQ